MSISAFSITVNQLHKLRSSFGEEFTQTKIGLLNKLQVLPFKCTKELLNYHELLLFISAYPDNGKILALATSERERLIIQLKIFEKKQTSIFHNIFDQTGVDGSMVTLTPSLDACKWMLRNFIEPKLQTDKTFTSKIGEILTFFCIATEQDGLSDDRFDTLEWIKMATGNDSVKRGQILEWIVNKIDSLNELPAIKEYLFEKAGINLTIQLNNPNFSRSAHFLEIQHPFFQSEKLLKNFDVLKKVNTKNLNAVKVTGVRKIEIIDSAKIVLASRGRETDPVTYAENVLEIKVERGLVIYLFEMNYEHKLPIENYTGFVAYRNGVPVGYGGGWIFIDRCEIGVNIFDTFRGGENNLIFTNILRVYNHVFGIKKFVVPPYQFGDDNEEGLKSGAFWFYYKLGFRPEDEVVAEIAESEYSKINKQPGYHSPLSTLKKLAWSPMELKNGKVKHDLEPKHLSIAQSKWIAAKFNGDGNRAIKESLKYFYKFYPRQIITKFTKAEKYFIKLWSPLILMSVNMDDLNVDEKKLLLEILKNKGQNEFVFSLLLKKHIKLLSAFNKCAFK